jgi:hypothetical protein
LSEVFPGVVLILPLGRPEFRHNCRKQGVVALASALPLIRERSLPPHASAPYFAKTMVSSHHKQYVRSSLTSVEFVDWERSQPLRYEFDGTQQVPCDSGAEDRVVRQHDDRTSIAVAAAPAQ